MSRISALLALLLCLCMTVSLAESDSLIAEELIKADSVNYDAAALESGLYERTFSASADEYFPHTYTIRYTGGGARFGEYLVTRGDEVKEGDRLAVLLQEGDEVALAEAKLELQRANEAMESETDSRREQIADMEQALLDVQDSLQQEIMKLRIARADVELEQYRDRQARTIAAIEESIAELEAAGQDDYLLAPADGVILSTEYRFKGQQIGSGEALISFYRTDGMLMRVDNTSGNLRYGMEVGVEVGANNKSRKVLPGRVVGADDLLPIAERRNYAYIAFENPDGLKLTRPKAVGASVSVENVALVVRRAVSMDGGKHFVTVLRDGVPQKRFINCVMVSGVPNAWVLQGLEPDDRIIVE